MQSSAPELADEVTMGGDQSTPITNGSHDTSQADNADDRHEISVMQEAATKHTVCFQPSAAAISWDSDTSFLDVNTGAKPITKNWSYYKRMGPVSCPCTLAVHMRATPPANSFVSPCVSLPSPTS